MLKILALDQASNCGFATDKASGTWDFRTKKDESMGSKLRRFTRKLELMHKAYKFDIIVYERVAGRHAASIIHGAKMAGAIELFCELNNIEYRAFSAKEIKLFATGKGNAGKPAMVKAAQEKYGMTGEDDNQADALHILHLARKTFI